MKTYTFKFKVYGAAENTSPVVIAINCPLEVLYNSVKGCKELVDFNGYITQTDYYDIHMNEDGTINSTWVDNDVFVGDIKALIDSDDLKDFLIHNTCNTYNTYNTNDKEVTNLDEIQESV